MYIRDPNSRAIINSDDGHYKAILARRADARKAAEVNNELNSLRNELDEIKQLLEQIVNGSKNG